MTKSIHPISDRLQILSNEMKFIQAHYVHCCRSFILGHHALPAYLLHPAADQETITRTIVMTRGSIEALIPHSGAPEFAP